MDFLTIFGLLAGIGTVYYVMSASNILHMLFNPQAIVLVFGGTISATLISYPWDILKHSFPAFRLVLFPRSTTDKDRHDMIETFTKFAEKARRQNIDSIQEDLKRVNNPFLIYGLQMVIDGHDPDIIKDNLEKEILYTRQRHHQVSNIFRTMATLSPIFGLLGTLIGVVQVLQNLSDPSNMGEGMAVAITTTFYGIFAANFIFLPIATKLTELSDRDILTRELATEGILSLQQGDLPLILRKKLDAFVSFYTRSKEQQLKKK